MRIAVIGAGISGIVAAHCMRKSGHEVRVFEKSPHIGGVWALGYPGVRLQNTGHHYRISDVPWKTPPDRHPSSGQILQYLKETVEELDLAILTGHEVTDLSEEKKGWRLRYRNEQGSGDELFDFVIVSIGQYSEGKHKPLFEGQGSFRGQIITERDVHDLDVFNDKRVVVIGFGKSAVDMATFAVERARQVHHVFRTPRWLIPFYVVGIHYTHLMFCRMGTVMMPCWSQPNRFEAFLHQRLAILVRGVWKLVSQVARLQCYVHGIGKSARAKAGLRAVLPDHDLLGDFRSAAAMAPEHYFRYVADEKILPRHAEIHAFTENGIRLSDDSVIDCDQVVLSLGSESPRFPFLPDRYRRLLEAEDDGVQLYRHLIHPRIPNMAFAGFNHGFMHVPAAEVGMLWLAALLDGDLELPSEEEMEQSIRRIRDWKRTHINFEPSRACAVNTRFQQYIDILLKDLGVSPYRKMPNIFAELFAQYGAEDYHGVHEEYRSLRNKQGLPRKVLALDT